MIQSATHSDFPAAFPDVIPGVQSARRMLHVSIGLLVLFMVVALNNAERLLPAATEPDGLRMREPVAEAGRAELSVPVEPALVAPSADAPRSVARPSNLPLQSLSEPLAGAPARSVSRPPWSNVPASGPWLSIAPAEGGSAKADRVPMPLAAAGERLAAGDDAALRAVPVIADESSPADEAVSGEEGAGAAVAAGEIASADQPESLSPMEALRRAEFAAMADYADRIEFAAGSAQLGAPTRRQLDRIFETLFLYQETSVGVRVTVPEGTGESGRQLADARAGALVGYLVARGLDGERFTVDTPGSEVPDEQRSRVYFDAGASVN